ncbi:MAG: hypothetical protein Q9175_002182 [Cornicularia normoerica]
MADAPAAPSAKHPGDRLASYFENFFRTVVGIATLGASITFSKIVQSPVPPFHKYGFSAEEIQYLLAASWLLFVLALAFTSFFASALSLWRPQAVAAFGTENGKDRRKVLWFATAVSALLFGLAIAAFLTLALVVVAYAGPVGWVVVAFTILFALMGYGSIIWQSPLEWPGWLVGFEQEEQDAFEKYLHRNETERQRGADGEDLTRMPTRRPSRQHRAERDGGSRDYGRSTSGGPAGGGRRYSRRDGGDDINRYSRASTVVTNVNEPGIFGHGGMMMYDNRVREGLVMSRYD